MTRPRTIALVEIVVALLPPTFILLPLLMYGALGTGFAVLTILVDRTKPFQDRWAISLHLIDLILWILSAAVGMAALWVAVVAHGFGSIQGTRARRLLIGGILLGIVAALRWLWVMNQNNESFNLMEAATWGVFIGAPLAAGLRHVFLLTRGVTG